MSIKNNKHCKALGNVAILIMFLVFGYSASAQQRDKEQTNLLPPKTLQGKVQFYISIPGITDNAKMVAIDSWSTGINMQDTSFIFSTVYFMMLYNEYSNPIKTAIAEKKKFNSISIYFMKIKDGKKLMVAKTTYKNAGFLTFNVGGNSESVTLPAASISFEYDEVEDLFYGETGGSKPLSSSVIKSNIKPTISEE